MVLFLLLAILEKENNGIFRYHRIHGIHHPMVWCLSSTPSQDLKYSPSSISLIHKSVYELSGIYLESQRCFCHTIAYLQFHTSILVLHLFTSSVEVIWQVGNYIQTFPFWNEKYLFYMQLPYLNAITAPKCPILRCLHLYSLCI